MISFTSEELFREWLVEAELDEEPFVVVVHGTLGIDTADGTHIPEHETSWREVPTWVQAVLTTMVLEEGINAGEALEERHRARRSKERVHPVLPHGRKVAWRRFLLLVAADPVTRRAIESTFALGDAEAAVSYIRPLFQEFVRKVAEEAPVAAALSARQARRARRLDGRAVRATDASYALESRPVRPRRKKASAS